MTQINNKNLAVYVKFIRGTFAAVDQCEVSVIWGDSLQQQWVYLRGGIWSVCLVINRVNWTMEWKPGHDAEHGKCRSKCSCASSIWYRTCICFFYKNVSHGINIRFAKLLGVSSLGFKIRSLMDNRRRVSTNTGEKRVGQHFIPCWTNCQKIPFRSIFYIGFTNFIHHFWYRESHEWNIDDMSRLPMAYESECAGAT